MEQQLESGLVVPGHVAASQPSESRQQQRAAERMMKKIRDKANELQAQGFPALAGHGDLRVVDCPQQNPDHPFHVMSFCGNHMRWEPMPDTEPRAAALIEFTVAGLAGAEEEE